MGVSYRIRDEEISEQRVADELEVARKDLEALEELMNDE